MTSLEMVEKALPAWNGRLAAHHIGYLGNGHVHRAVPYNAIDPKVIAKKLKLMRSDGVSVVIETWQGPWSGTCHTDATLTASLCAQFGMQFALLLDPGGMQRWKKNQSTEAITANVVTALSDPTTAAMLNGISYVPEKYILDFNTGADLTALAAKFPTYNFLKMGQGFSWISIPDPLKVTESVAKNAWSVANLQKQHANPAMKVASFCDGFDDSGNPQPPGVSSQAAFDTAGGKRDWSSSVWGGPARVLESFAGVFVQQQLATINPATPIIAILSWDDYDEQSSGPREKILAEECGIDWNV